jgi:septal ring factor EnvC (AmiA/AmiB activator)
MQDEKKNADTIKNLNKNIADIEKWNATMVKNLDKAQKRIADMYVQKTKREEAAQFQRELLALKTEFDATEAKV